MDTLSWYAAKTRFGQELKIKEVLQSRGIEHFIPVERRKDYRGKMKDTALIHNLVFLRAGKDLACSLRTELGLPLRYLFDYARHSMLVVPDKQMEDFIRVFDASEGKAGLTDVTFAPGESVRVVKGPLAGVEGTVRELLGEVFVEVTLAGIISARAKVPRAWMEKIEGKP
jgi:transcription antitermination factor NusG